MKRLFGNTTVPPMEKLSSFASRTASEDAGTSDPLLFETASECKSAFQRYVGVGEDPLSVLDPGEEAECEVEAVCKEYLKDFNISDDDSWGNEEQQARMGATTTILCGVYKGLPQALPLYHLYSDKASSPNLYSVAHRPGLSADEKRAAFEDALGVFDGEHISLWSCAHEQ